MDNQNENPQLEKNEIVLEKYDTKHWLISFALGIFLGLAVIIPGLSGAAVAIILGLYDKLLYAVSNIFKSFKTCIKFLLPIIIGFVIGFIVGFFAVDLLIDLIPFSMICLFAALMVGALPSVTQEIKGKKKDSLRVGLLVIGILIPLIVGGLSIYFASTSDSINLGYGLTKSSESATQNAQAAENLFGDFPFQFFLIAIPVGFVLGMTQVVPGLSATAFLMMIGYYRPILSSVSLTYWKAHPIVLLFYIIIAISALVGFFFTSKFINYLFSKKKELAYHVIVGLSIGAILSMFLNPDVYGVYLSWATENAFGNPKIIADFCLFVPMLVLGFFLSHKLVKYGEGNEAKQVENNNSEAQ